MMTWEEMTAIEPRLQALYERAKGYRNNTKINRNLCANRVWYGRDRLKGELCNLVGWGVRDTRLSSPIAYDIAYRKIYDALPDCRHEETIC
ncbi:MAG: hypothetical protein ACYC0Q_05930 [Eubacteriales bacterium]